ncbi:MAG: hypothetical protein ACRBN8_28300 [Nannocystales bacterium]
MFIIFGDKHRTETVADGLRVERECPACKTVAMFRERVVTKRFRLYFVDMFTHGTHHVLECGECGQTFVTDELPKQQLENDQSGTLLGHVQGLVDRGKDVARDPRVVASVGQAQAEATRALGAAQQEATKVFGTAEKTVKGWISAFQRPSKPET